MNRTLGMLTLVALHCAAQAQTSGKLRFIVDPGDSYQFRLDHQFTLQQREIELATGAHTFSFWAPERMILDTTLVVEEGLTKSVLVQLPFSTDYMLYQRQLGAYRKDMKLHKLVPALITGGALAYTVASWFNMNKAHDQLDDDRTAYDNGTVPYRITKLKEETIPAHKDDFAKARSRFVAGAATTVVFAGVTAYLFHQANKKPVPTFLDKEKIRFDGLTWVPSPEGGEWLGGLTWNFAR